MRASEQGHRCVVFCVLAARENADHFACVGAVPSDRLADKFDELPAGYPIAKLVGADTAAMTGIEAAIAF